MLETLSKALTSILLDNGLQVAARNNPPRAFRKCRCQHPNSELEFNCGGVGPGAGVCGPPGSCYGRPRGRGRCRAALRPPPRGPGSASQPPGAAGERAGPCGAAVSRLGSRRVEGLRGCRGLLAAPPRQLSPRVPSSRWSPNPT